MDLVWRLRLMIVVAVTLLLFGDFFGYGSVRGVKSDSNQGSNTPNRPSKFQHTKTDIDIHEESELNKVNPDATATGFDATQKLNSKLQSREQLLKEHCLPKMLCEIASKPDYKLSDKEKELLRLIRSPTMPWVTNAPPTVGYFAAHMGELLRFTSDNLSGPMGCANLWPSCPMSSKGLMNLSRLKK